MNKILIKQELFSLDNNYSSNLLSSIFSLYKNNVDIILPTGVDEMYLKIFQNEGIEYKNLNSYDESELPELGYSKRIILKGWRGIEQEFSFENISQAVEFITKNNRSAEIHRSTNETDINIKINLDGTGESNISTGLGFFDHMLEQIAKHSNSDLQIKVDGDLQVDEHHTVEDTGLALGEVIASALGDKKGIKRFGYFIPMDDSHAHCSIDLSGRPYLKFKCKFSREKVGEFPTELAEEFFKSLANGMKSNIFMRTSGKNDHHKIEAMFKCFAKALNEACRMDERNRNQLPSTKGIL